MGKPIREIKEQNKFLKESIKKVIAHDGKEVFFYNTPERLRILKEGTPKEKAELYNNLSKLLHWWDSDKPFFKAFTKAEKEVLYKSEKETEQQLKDILDKVGYCTNDKENKEQYIHFTIGICMHQIPLYDNWNEDITPYLFNEDGSIKPYAEMLKSFYKIKGINPEENKNQTDEDIKDLTDEQQTAIKELLENEGEELKNITEIKDEEGGLFIDMGYKSYLIMTEEEAQQRAEEYIEGSVWAFNTSFLIGYMHDGMTEEAIKLIQEGCEGANEPLTSMINDIDQFIEDAISTYGRGHFLSSYDGQETELKNGYVYIREG